MKKRINQRKKRIYKLNNNDVGLQELMKKEGKGREQICKERITDILEDLEKTKK